MKPRLNPYQAAPDAMKAVGALETYVQGSGLEPGLIDLVKTRASQINGCAFCIHITPAKPVGAARPRSGSTCWTPGGNRRSIRSASGRRWPGRKP